MDPLVTIAVVMFLCGILGGLINSFIAGTNATENAMPWWKQVVVGVGASFMVPLFLNMISSGLIDSIRGVSGNPGTPGDPSKLFVLAGFCLVAAVSSRAFITSLTSRVLQEVQEAKKEAEQAQADAAMAKDAVAPFVEADESEGAAEDNTDAIQAFAQPMLSEDEVAVVKAMANSSFSMRSLSGLIKQTEIDKARVNVAIGTLLEKTLVAQGTSQKGFPRWFLTTNGRIAAAKI